MPRRLRSHSAFDPSLDPLPEAWDIEQHQVIADQYVANQTMNAANNNNNADANANANDANIEWKTNPHIGNFNPGTDTGRKIFNEKTKGLPEADRLALSKSNSAQIQRYFKAREQYLSILSAIPIEWNNDGSVKTTASLLSQSYMISLQDVQREAHKRFGNVLAPADPIPSTPFSLREINPGSDEADKATFYDRVHSNVAVELIKNCLTPMGYEDLMLQKEKFTFKGRGIIELDGPTMLYLLYEKIDPSTTVGLDSVLEAIEDAKLSNYSNDVDKMLTEMESNYKILKENGQAPRNIIKLLFKALKSGSNAVYNDFVQRIEDDVDSGLGVNKNISHDDLIVACRTKYNNMHKKGTWDKVDPRDAQMLALTTMVENLKLAEQQRPTPQPSKGTSAAAAHAIDSNQQQQPVNLVSGTTVEEWRIKFDGPTKQRGGKKWYWCPHHVLEGKWNGMYALHPPDKHRGKKPKATTPTPTASSAPPAEKSELALNSRLKQVLMTNLCISDEDVDKMFKEATSSSGN